VAGDAYTGLRRRKQTPWTVKFGDAIVSRVIAIGGIGTIAAILLVVLVLVGTALPLFHAPQFGAWHQVPEVTTGAIEGDARPSVAAESAARYQHMGMDDNGLMLWGMLPSGTIEVRGIIDGRLLRTFSLDIAAGVTLTASQLSIDGTGLALGFSDGTFQVANIAFTSTLISPQSLPSHIVVSAESPVASDADTVYQWFDSQGVRQSSIEPLVWSTPKRLGDGPVWNIDYVPSESANQLSGASSSSALAVVGSKLIHAQIESKRNRLTKKVTEAVELSAGPLRIRNSEGRPLQVALISEPSQGVIVWPDGTLDRYQLKDGRPRLVESRTVAVHRAVVSAAPLLGRQSLLCGLDDGRLQAWMITRAAGEEAEQRADEFQLSLAHEIQVGAAPLTSIASSRSAHVAVTCDEQNNIGLVYVTTDQLLARHAFPGAHRLRAVVLGPNSQALIAATDETVEMAALDLGHPEASWGGYFGRVWYEGHDQPKYIWQSSAATQQSEIKLSLMPLVFGTLKATFYALLISVPLAILTAIYTSEFLSPVVRGRIKPAIEMMASLPSVVLGYVAALVVAPYLQEHLMQVLVALIVFPWTFVFVGNLWNLLPVEKMVRFQGYRLLGLLICLPIALAITLIVAPWVEQWLFAGSIIDWLSGQNGSGLGGWFLLSLPSLIVVWGLILMGPLAERQRVLATRCSPRVYALLSLVRLSMASVALVAAAWGLGWLLSSVGLDPRGYLFDTYQDRNALLVGFALGFCVIPIVYTISDDALQSVPSQLRSASLGCGATPWQTTMRIVVPSAMSGLFSAVMIGLGRAVGETMVVLCAAGNTPLMEWNPFNGFKTLSAALATELPEAAKGSTHYRTLFLAAVLLFFMTLVINTLAEFVRIRFRKRASQL
jgi:phosphate transport system permease protein